MSSFASSSLKLLRRLLHAGAGQDAPHAGAPTVLDGLSAVAATEARVCDVAALGASHPAALGARVWAGQESARGVNEFGDVVSSVAGQSPRGALAAAIGAAMAGQRATAFVSGSDLAGCTDLLMQASGQHLPLVVHLASRATSGHAQAIGTGHEAYHAASEAGCFQLYAANVQEAVDLSIIARRVTEASLVPGIVAMDSQETALAAQDVLLGDDAFLKMYLGRSSEMIESPTQAQRMVFGATRRRVPRMYDLDRPMLVGSLQGPESFGLGVAGGKAYFADQVSEILGKAVDSFAEQTGRRYDGLVTYKTDDAQLVLIVQGSAFETVQAIADWAREHERVKVGVIGVRCLRPLDGAALARALKGSGVAAVMERVDAPLSGDGPLMREVRAAVDRARENARFGDSTHAGYPAIGDNDLPRLVEVGYGIGGMEVRGADLAALIGELREPKRAGYYLGLEMTRATSSYPKHQALMDALKRDFPKLSSLGVRGTGPGPDLLGSASMVVRLCRYAGREHEALAGEVAGVLHGLLGGSIRSRPASTWQRFDEPCADWLVHGFAGDPGDDVRVDIAATPLGRIDEHLGLADRLSDDGVIVLVAGGTDEQIWDSLSRDVQGALSGSGRSLQVVSVSEEISQKPWAVSEALLGGVLAAYFTRLGEKAPAESKVKAAREVALGDLTEEDRELRLGVFVQAMGSARRVEVSGFTVRAAGVVEERAPGIVRAMGKTKEKLGNLPRFWDQTGVFYKAGRTDELLADPYMAVGAVPALSSAFRDVSKTRRVLPEFDAASCDVCPELWMTCPDGSVAPFVISARALIDAGIDLVTEAGGAADALRPIAGKLAKGINKVAVGEDAPRTAAGLLEAAFGGVVAKMDDDRRVAAGEALAAVVEQVGEMPLAATDVFFKDAERVKAGSGELFCLVVDPDACKCPELIMATGEGRGLKAVEQTPEAVGKARRLWELWEKLPDTNGATIERLRTLDGFGPLAAMMLSRHCLRAMGAGDGAEAGSGSKLALRQVLGVAEFHLQPRMQKLVGEIEGLRGKLAERIQELLGQALPTADLDALAEGLDVLGRDDVELSALSAKVDSALVEGMVDGARLGRLVDAARGLADLQWQISTGPDGLGRARVGMTIASGAVAGWSAVFPYNPFAAPAVVDGGGGGGDAGQIARGLLEGHLRQVVAGFRFMRWARMELERPNEAPHAAGELAGLRFADLTDDEKALVPPMLVVGDGQTIGEAGLSTLVWLMDSGLPVKVVVLSDIGGAADGAMSVDALGSYPAAQRFDVALLALLSRKAFVAQTSVAAPEHFAASVEGALATAGPALIHVHAPSPERHGFAVERLHEQARLALVSRAFPVLTFDPSKGGVFGSCLDISANPEPMSRFCSGADGLAVTPADWAATEARFNEHLRPVADGDPSPMPIAEYLMLDPAERAGRTPYVLVGDGDAKRKMAVGESLVADADDRVRLWRTLEELSGQVTPFTEKVRADVERDVAAGHDAQVARIKQEYEAKLSQLRGQFEVEATQSVTNRLMELAGYAANGNGGVDGGVEGGGGS